MIFDKDTGFSEKVSVHYLNHTTGLEGECPTTFELNGTKPVKTTFKMPMDRKLVNTYAHILTRGKTTITFISESGESMEFDGEELIELTN